MHHSLRDTKDRPINRSSRTSPVVYGHRYDTCPLLILFPSYFVSSPFLLLHPPSRSSDPWSNCWPFSTPPPAPTKASAMEDFCEKRSDFYSLVDSPRMAPTHCGAAVCILQWFVGLVAHLDDDNTACMTAMCEASKHIRLLAGHPVYWPVSASRYSGGYGFGVGCARLVDLSQPF